MQKTLIVVGGGAAGFFCAINAAQMNPALRIIITEKSNKLLSKVKVSGGGRCNVTHHCFDITELIKNYPRGNHFLKKAFHWFNTQHTISWFKQRNIALKAEPDGRMFPVTNNSQTIIDCFLNEVKKYAIEIKTQCEIESFIKEESVFKLTTQNNEILTCNYLCIATGGYSKMLQFQWLQKSGHSIENPLPSLFTFNIPNNTITQLMGISLDNVQVKIMNTKFQTTGSLLITHWGLSGPAVLKLSAFAAKDLFDKKYQFTIQINWLNSLNEQRLREDFALYRNRFSTNKMYSKNPFTIPNRLWHFLLLQSNITDDCRWADLQNKQLNSLIKNLTAKEFDVKGKTTFKEEFVTCGGIKLSEVDVNTMQSKIIPKLYFAGEILNIDGITGGFNFQSAWTTGFIAAKAIAESE
jgi:predicted Rossmann fold flavoprotein